MSDCDGDGLTDNVEIYELGTDIEKIDTDGDGISDGREVKPFQWFGTRYLDPLQADSNGDGIDDGEECFTRADFDGTNLVVIDDVPCLDRDMDEVPDVFDFDNDGDGVPDAVDISPNDAQVVEDNQRFNSTWWARRRQRTSWSICNSAPSTTRTWAGPTASSTGAKRTTRARSSA
ncbi:MAG: hypothetical protein R2932_28965 [Caldilineaceae bacterium]